MQVTQGRGDTGDLSFDLEELVEDLAPALREAKIGFAVFVDEGHTSLADAQAASVYDTAALDDCFLRSRWERATSSKKQSADRCPSSFRAHEEGLIYAPEWARLPFLCPTWPVTSAVNTPRTPQTTESQRP